MPRPRLIGDYLTALSADLPGRIVDELADGLDETYRCHLGQGLDPDTAAQVAVAEFGEPRLIAAAFTDASRARRSARRLLAIGPAVGSCWACRAAATACVGTVILDVAMTGAVLITVPALAWPVAGAVALSAGRSSFALRNVHHALTG